MNAATQLIREKKKLARDKTLPTGIWDVKHPYKDKWCMKQIANSKRNIETAKKSERRKPQTVDQRSCSSTVLTHSQEPGNKGHLLRLAVLIVIGTLLIVGVLLGQQIFSEHLQVGTIKFLAKEGNVS